jgi:glutamine synthetase
MANSANDVLKMIKDQEIEWVDLRFTDPKGKWQHLTMVSGVVGEDELTDGFMFDGSSIEGWKAINESDMILKPDLDAVWIDPFSATPMLILVCDIVEPSTGELYARDPRSTAKRAEAYLKTTGIGDTIYIGPEAEFFMFDNVQFETATRRATTRSTISSCRPTPAANMRAAISATVRAPRAAISRSRRSTAPSTSAARWSRPCSKWACPATSITMRSPPRSTSWA